MKRMNYQQIVNLYVKINNQDATEAEDDSVIISFLLHLQCKFQLFVI